MNKLLNKVVGGIGVITLAGLVAACSSPMGSNASTAARNGVAATMSARVIDISEAPHLGQAASFAVFGGGAGITNSGTGTRIAGDMGTTGASTMITGFHSAVFSYAETPLNVGAVSGKIYTNAPQGSAADFAYAKTVAADALAAFNDLAGRTGGVDPGAGQLGGLTLASGVYKSASGAFQITGSDLTLDAQGNPDALWIFQMASTLTVGSPTASRSVVLVNGAKAANVYWQVGSAATINGEGGGSMAGTIIASAGMTFSTAGNFATTTLNGRALALFASVTMVNAIINASGEPSAAVPIVATPPAGGAVTVTNTGSGRVTVTATGAAAITLPHTGDEDFTYPN
jgi:hypothetical protein